MAKGKISVKATEVSGIPAGRDLLPTLMAITTGLTVITYLYIRYTQLSLPLDRDEGSLLYSAYCLLQGKIPYVDFYEVKPPGIFVVYAIFHLLFGYGNEALHLGLVLLQTGIAVLFYKTSLRLFESRTSGYLAVTLFLILCMNPYFLSFALMSEFFLIMFLLMSILPLLTRNKEITKREYFISGLCLGVAAMIRQHTLFFAIPYLIFLLYSTGWNFRQVRKPLLYATGGALSIVLPLVLYVAARGALDEMYYWIWQRPNESFMQQVSFSEGKVHLNAFLKLLTNTYAADIVWVFVLGMIYLLTTSADKRPLTLALLIFLIFSVASVFPGNRFYGHYWILTFPSVILISSAAVMWLERIKSVNFRYAAFAVIPLLLLVHIIRNKESFFPDSQDGLYRFIYGDNANYTLHNLTRYLKNRIKKGEEVFVFGSEPQVYYECRSIPSTRHSYIATVHVPGTTNVPYQREVIQYLQSRKPEYIMHIQYAYSIYMTEESSRELYNWIFSFENNNYDVIALAEENDNRQIKYLYEKDAAAYTPSASKYIILYRRKSGF